MGNIRNVAILGHSGVGKTTVCEGILYQVGRSKRFGKVDDGNTQSDFLPEEKARKVSVSTSLLSFSYQDKTYNLLDTPGYADFWGEVESAIHGVDGALFVLCGSSGIQVQTEALWRRVSEIDIPKIVFINKLERDNANFFKVAEALQNSFSKKILCCHFPIGNGKDFCGIYDLIHEQVSFIKGKEIEGQAFLNSLEAELSKARSELLEVAVESDDRLMEKYFAGEEITPEERLQGLSVAIKGGDLIPLGAGSAFELIGLKETLGLIDLLSAPTEDKAQSFEAKDSDVELLIFKTLVDPYVGKMSLARIISGTIKSEDSLYNPRTGEEERIGGIFSLCGKEQMSLKLGITGNIVAISKLNKVNTGDTLVGLACESKKNEFVFPEPTYALAIIPKTKNDEDKLGGALSRLLEEDPVLRVERNLETKENLLWGLGDLHLDIAIERLSKRFGVKVDTKTPEIPYRETFSKPIRVEGKHKKQTGGHGQYGHVWLQLEPCPGEDLVFEQKIFGGAVPKQYFPAVEKGIKEAMSSGTLAGYPVVGVKATLVDGSYHPVDSSEMSFKLAGALAFRKGAALANPRLLEPIMEVSVRVPEDLLGDVISDLNSRRGRVLGFEPDEDWQLINAWVPLAEMLQYPIVLRSLSQGKGSFSMKLKGYEEVPEHLMTKIIASRNP